MNLDKIIPIVFLVSGAIFFSMTFFAMVKMHKKRLDTYRKLDN